MGAGGDEGFDFGYGLDGSAGAYGGAVEGCGCAGEVELAGEGPVLEEAVDEAGVKDVSGAGGVEDGDVVGGSVVEGVAVVGEDAVGAEGGGGEAAVVAAVHLLKCAFEVGLLHETGGEVAGDDGVVDVGEELFDAGVELVEVGDDGDIGLAGPASGLGGGGGVVAVDVEGAGVDDPLALEVGGLEDEAGFGVAADEDGALAFGVDEDEGLGAGCSGDGDDTGFDAGVGEGLAMKGGGEIVAELADVAGLESPELAGDDSGGDLSAGENRGGGVLDLGAADGVFGEGNDGVGGVEAYAYEVDLGRGLHVFMVLDWL